MAENQGRQTGDLPVRCRVDNSQWIIVLLFGGFGLAPVLCLWLTPARMVDRVMMSLLGAAFALPALLLALWPLRAEITADENGLRWRGLGSPVSVVIHRRAGMGVKDDPMFVSIMATLMGGSILWAIWRYHQASIGIDGDGITQNVAFCRRFLRWDQVERFFKSGGDAYMFGNVVGAGTRIRFWTGIADVEELKDEVARRAVNSRNQTWDEAETVKQRKVIQGR